MMTICIAFALWLLSGEYVIELNANIFLVSMLLDAVLCAAALITFGD